MQDWRTRQGERVAELDEDPGADELDHVDDHPADRAGVEVQAEHERTLDGELAQELADVDAALERVEQGSFGRCEVCGRDIDDERLRAVPVATRCRDHA